MLRKLFRCWQPQPAPPLDHLDIVFYSRRGCHLCESAWELLTAAQRQHGYRLRALDIDTDAALVAQHGDKVPVVAVNGKVRFWGRINKVLLERLLQGERRRAGLR